MKCNAQICMNTHTRNTYTAHTCAHNRAHTHTHAPKYMHAKTQIFLMHKKSMHASTHKCVFIAE